MLAVGARDVMTARRSQSSGKMPKSLAKMSQLSLPKRPWFSPFLTESAPQVEFVLTYSKQTTGKFLTEARTHIKDFRISANFDTKFRPVDTRLPPYLDQQNVLAVSSAGAKC